MRYSIAILGGLGLLWWVTAAQATLITFDSLPTTANTVITDEVGTDFTHRPGALTELILQAGGVTMTMYRENEATFDLVDNTISTQTGKSDSFGDVSVDIFSDTSNNALIFSFSDVIRTFSILVGDFGRDLDHIVMVAYESDDAGGDFIAGSFAEQYLPDTGEETIWTETRFDITSETGFQSVKFIGGLGDFDVFFDRVFFELGVVELSDEDIIILDDPENQGSETIIVPEPTTLALLSLASFSLLRKRR